MSKLAHSNDETMEQIETNNLKAEGYSDEQIAELRRLPVPDLNGVDVAFGNIKHMPKYDTLPKEFQNYHSEPHCKFCANWFYNGVDKEGMKQIVAKEGVDRSKALNAIQAVLGSWEPKHEHKMAACGYMLSQWFTLTKAGA